MSTKKVYDTRQHSRLVVDGLKQTAARAMLRAVGFGDADFGKPQVGVASTWARLTPCNMHIRELAEDAVAGVDGAGGQERAFQYDHRLGRHLHGLARNALFARLA